ncbi:hypothetical protein F2P58_22755 [Vibrio fortis]|uniref:DUF3592 domain-containing protein n=1 Tax=Vibrio fortis TaxID=212667 RepID=A0A5N3QSZ2_9VIBR|nr:hypothetical protein [Vibrio fortis]KAB0285344.1 hypothetical protein F2P58_22755 [Vibrio fortis]
MSKKWQVIVSTCLFLLTVFTSYETYAGDNYIVDVLVPVKKDPGNSRGSAGITTIFVLKSNDKIRLHVKDFHHQYDNFLPGGVFYDKKMLVKYAPFNRGSDVYIVNEIEYNGETIYDGYRSLNIFDYAIIILCLLPIIVNKICLRMGIDIKKLLKSSG